VNRTSDILSFFVLKKNLELFTYMETSPPQEKGCEILAYTRRSGPLNRDGSFSCDTGPRFIRSHPKDRIIQSPLMTREGMLRSILTRILTCRRKKKFICLLYNQILVAITEINLQTAVFVDVDNEKLMKRICH
jgi:hypothetical protein